jgi:hypothetical protein
MVWAEDNDRMAHKGCMTMTGGECKVCGGSDDTFGIYGALTLDDDDCARGTTRELALMQPDGSGLIIRGKYGALEAGVWLISVAPLDEDKPFKHPITVEQDGYTMVLRFKVDPETSVSLRRFKRSR